MKRGWTGIGRAIGQKCKDAAESVQNSLKTVDEKFDGWGTSLEKKAGWKPNEEPEKLDKLVKSIIRDCHRPTGPFH